VEVVTVPTKTSKVAIKLEELISEKTTAAASTDGKNRISVSKFIKFLLYNNYFHQLSKLFV
jgi:hypothetical protein